MKKNCLEIVRQKCESCHGCALGATRNNIVFSDGDAATARIVLIGEAPGETEDLRNIKDTILPDVNHTEDVISDDVVSFQELASV